ncbi:MAG: hypothetical protein Q9218_007026, partial [Villophora microphyllina]
MAKGSRADNELPAYELIQRSRSGSQPFHVPLELDDDLDKPTSRLPPRPLPGRRQYRPFIVATLATVTGIVPLAVLVKCIPSMLPQFEWNGLKLDGISCDLIDNKNSSRMQSAFQINLRGAAHLTFAEAKFVDLIFDLVVGQGGRLLLGAISYIVFMDALVRSMEITPVSFKLYTSLVFAPSSLITTWRSTKAIFTTKGWKAKMYLIWCALAMSYVLAFPTLIESATGYVQPSSAGFNINNTVIRADSDDLLNCFHITGGLLLGLDQNITNAPGPPAHEFDGTTYNSDSSERGYILSTINRTNLYYQLLTYVPNEYIYNVTNSTTSPMAAFSLGELNRSDIALDSEGYPIDYNYTTNITINGQKHFFQNMDANDVWGSAYCYGNQTFASSDLRQSPFCFSKTYFVWGFSSIVLYIILGLQIIWTFGMYCVWLDANIASELVKSGRTVRGHFRAAADLAEALNETLGHEYCTYTDKEIEKELERSGKRLKYYGSQRDDDGPLHVGITTEEVTSVLLSRKMLYGAARRKTVDHYIPQSTPNLSPDIHLVPTPSGFSLSNRPPMAQNYYPPTSQPYQNPQANLNFYQSSYPAPVSGHSTPSQAQYPYTSNTYGQQQNYGGSSSFGGFGGVGGGGGVSGRMGEQGGLRTGWLAAFGTEGYEGEPPLLEELGVNFGHIKGKTLTVLNPLAPISRHIMDDSDLAGPILFFLLFGTFLLFSGKVHFGYIYGLALVGSLSLHTIFSLMSPPPDHDSPTHPIPPSHGGHGND